MSLTGPLSQLSPKELLSEEVMALATTMKLARFANGPLARNMASLATTGFKQCLLNTPPTQVGAGCFNC